MNPGDTPEDDEDGLIWPRSMLLQYVSVFVWIPEQSDAGADHDVVQGVEAHHAH